MKRMIVKWLRRRAHQLDPIPDVWWLPDDPELRQYHVLVSYQYLQDASPEMRALFHELREACQWEIAAEWEDA